MNLEGSAREADGAAGLASGAGAAADWAKAEEERPATKAAARDGRRNRRFMERGQWVVCVRFQPGNGVARTRREKDCLREESA